MTTAKISSATTAILWAVYLGLLAVLLPHTAWAFRNWEPPATQAWVVPGTTITSSDIISYIAAFAFESAIAVLTHKLAKHLETTKPVTHTRRNSDGTQTRITDAWATFQARYVNAISLGLVMATVVSALANLAHAVEFGQPLRIFAEWGIPQEFYSLAFGGVLPFVSLLFARVLSNVVESEEAPNPELQQAKATVTELSRKLREAGEQVKAAEEKARLAEDRFGAAGDLMKALMSDDKKERIVLVRRQWPQLTQSSIAVITGASPSHVSEVLKETDVIDA